MTIDGQPPATTTPRPGAVAFERLVAWLATADGTDAEPPPDAATAIQRAAQLGLHVSPASGWSLAERIPWPDADRGRVGARWTHGDRADDRETVAELAELGVRDWWIELDGAEWSGDDDGSLRWLFGAASDPARSVVVSAGADVVVAKRLRERLAGDASVSVTLDPLTALARSGGPADLAAALGEIADATRVSVAEGSSARTVAISTSWAHQAGATPAEGLALGLAMAAHYLRAGRPPEVSVASFARRVVFRVDVGTQLFAEVAKLRAARLLWAHLLGCCEPTAAREPLLVHAFVSPRTWSKLDPWNNVLRATISAAAARIGGADVVYHEPMDRLAAQRSRLARRLAVNGDAVLRAEAHLNQVLDPAAGSDAVERQTETLVHRAWATFTEIERDGGIVELLRRGAWASTLAERAAEAEAALRAGQGVQVGVSHYQRSAWPDLSDAVAPTGDASPADASASPRPSLPTSVAAPGGVVVPPFVPARLAAAFEAATLVDTESPSAAPKA
ncbi:MAG: hypothetical protein B7733_08810 [Myxococcales bacterium FL481]|nr:MAG: hypothetical protein B7733_08810 [Myxococcales bacterium FL481]